MTTFMIAQTCLQRGVGPKANVSSTGRRREPSRSYPSAKGLMAGPLPRRTQQGQERTAYLSRKRLLRCDDLGLLRTHFPKILGWHWGKCRIAE